MQTLLLTLIAFGLLGALAGISALYLKLHRRLAKLDALVGKVLREARGGWGDVGKLMKERDLELRKFMTATHLKTQQAVNDDHIQSGYINAIGTMYTKFPVFMGGPALDGFTSRVLFDRIERDRPKVILELGSGSSTVMIAALLEKLGMMGTRHIAIDDSEHYLEVTKRNYERHGFRRKAEFWHCPLVSTGEGEPAWYDGVADRLQGEQVDLVLVDGPPSFLHPRSREPALRAIYPFLSERAVVILDDTKRDAEKAIVQAWREEFPDLDVQVQGRGKGCVEFIRSPA